ncbi:molybdenum cofactor guanylyltransferase [Paenibacillus sp. N4]|uniref:molybdenum cofactor guanylyltransferase n=1 Tax=Paenibacillus vietnamensis TaxID=2590547 RepID=UPI001CD05605|nr:molybdenum cofactor guanylyltransferase [Paenibacillus vietnamensis]MCA0756133.1 molybdenum cofactor guanylyltransferase [Paenibacillus vietnamensis]
METIVQGLVLAGGKSSRMGTDKALLTIEGKPLVYRLAGQLLERLPAVAVSVGPPERESVYRKAMGELAGRAAFVADGYPDCGPLAGLHAGLAAAPPGYVFVIACDMPAMSPALFDQLAAHIGSGADVIHCEGQPFHALYHTRVAEAVRGALESQDYRVMGLLGRLSTVTVEPRDEAGRTTAFTNLNTPDDYRAFSKQKEEP